MHCFLKSLIVIRRYHHFTHRAANHCCQSLIEVYLKQCSKLRAKLEGYTLNPVCTIWLPGAHILVPVYPVIAPYFRVFLYT